MDAVDPVLEEHRQFVEWCAAWATECREAGALRTCLRDLLASLERLPAPVSLTQQEPDPRQAWAIYDTTGILLKLTRDDPELDLEDIKQLRRERGYEVVRLVPAGAAASSWIPCSERMPANEAIVLVFGRYEDAAVSWDWQAVCAFDADLGIWRGIPAGAASDEVTHWAPLLAPPAPDSQ